jgi:toxin FitB
LILADTDVLIDYLAGVQPIAGEIASYIQSDGLLTTAINCFELLSGAREGKRGDAVRRLVHLIPILAVDRQAALEAARVCKQLAESGLSIGMADSLIAGTALASNLPLITRNRKHFERIEDLQLVPLSRNSD